MKTERGGENSEVWMKAKWGAWNGTRAECQKKPLHLFTETPAIRPLSTKIERFIRYKCAH